MYPKTYVIFLFSRDHKSWDEFFFLSLFIFQKNCNVCFMRFGTTKQRFGRVDPNFWSNQPKTDEDWGYKFFISTIKFLVGVKFGLQYTQKNLTPPSIEFFFFFNQSKEKWLLRWPKICLYRPSSSISWPDQKWKLPNKSLPTEILLNSTK